MKKLILFFLVLAVTGGIQSCGTSNGDRAKPGKSDTVGTKTDPTNTATPTVKDTLKH